MPQQRCIIFPTSEVRRPGSPCATSYTGGWLCVARWCAPNPGSTIMVVPLTTLARFDPPATPFVLDHRMLLLLVELLLGDLSSLGKLFEVGVPTIRFFEGWLGSSECHVLHPFVTEGRDSSAPPYATSRLKHTEDREVEA